MYAKYFLLKLINNKFFRLKILLSKHKLLKDKPPKILKTLSEDKEILVKSILNGDQKLPETFHQQKILSF